MSLDTPNCIKCGKPMTGYAKDSNMVYCEVCSTPDRIFGKEMVDHPKHYNTGRFEVIDVIEDWGLGFNAGNALKYIARAEHKGEFEEDIKKAIWYLQRLLGENKKLDGGVKV